MPDTSISLGLRDNVSPSMKTIQDNAKPLSKEFEEMSGKVDALKQKNDALNKSYADLSTKIIDAKKAMQDAKNEYKNTASDANRENLTAATKNYKDLTDRVTGFKNASADTRKEIRTLQQDMHQMENGGGSDSSGGFSGLMKSLVTAGLGHMVGQTAQQASQYVISSAFSSEAGNAISSALGNAITGAAIGSIVPGIGTAIGAAVGAGTGAVNGLVKNAEEKDNAMRNYAAESEQSAIQASSTRAQTSSDTAAKREQDQIAFSSLMGSEKNAKSLLHGINDMANHTPYIYDDLAGISKTLNVYGDKNQKSILSHLTTIGNTGAAIGLSTSDMDSVAQIMGFMGSNGKLDSMLLKQLRRKGINANQMLAESYGVSGSQFSKMVSGGKISGADAMNRLYEKLETKFAGMMGKQSRTFTGLQSTIKGLKENTESTEGKAQNKVSKKGMEEEITLYQGKTGKELSKMYSMIGTGKGIQKNYETRIRDEVMTGVLKGGKIKDSNIDSKAVAEIKKLHDAYVDASKSYKNGNEKQKMDAAGKMDGIRKKMDILSGNIIDSAKVFDSLDESDKSVAKYSQKISSILGAYKDKWALDQTRTKGIQAYFSGAQGNKTGIYGLSALREGESGSSSSKKSSKKKKAKSHAYGENNVPYDGYLIEAHQGETLLTAEQARRPGGGSVPIVIKGNVFNVRKESDISAIAAELARQLNAASTTYGG